MDQIEKLHRYRMILSETVKRQAAQDGLPDGSESIAVCDPVGDNYLLLDVGWGTPGRIHDVLAHLRLKDGKVLIEYDGIEYGIAEDLIEAGIPAEDIVTAWRRRPSLPVEAAMAA